MVPGPDKIRSLKENSAGKVVVDDGGVNRWEWQFDDETARQLKQLHNDALSIESTDLRPRARPGAKPAVATPRRGKAFRAAPKSSRDAGGGFNPYDNSGKPSKR